MKNKILENMKQSISINDYGNHNICISFIGGPGHGKTTVSRILCEKIPMFFCSNDYIARQLEKQGIDLSDYEKKTQLVSSIAFPLQDYLFINGIDFVLDANLMLYLDVLKNRCKNYNYKLFIIQLQINPEDALNRSLKRLKENNTNSLSNSDEKDFQIFLNQLESYKENSEYIYAKINTEGDLQSIENQVDDLIEKIKEELHNESNKKRLLYFKK